MIKKINLVLIMFVFFISLIGCSSKIETFQDCEKAGGEIVKTHPRQCIINEVAYVDEVDVKHVLDVQNELVKHQCPPANSTGCTTEIKPVCGWLKDDVKCERLPCANEYTNQCYACKDVNVAYFTEGVCPENHRIGNEKPEDRAMNIAMDAVNNHPEFNQSKYEFARVIQEGCENCHTIEIANKEMAVRVLLEGEEIVSITKVDESEYE